MAAREDPRVVAVNEIQRIDGDLVIEMEHVVGRDLTNCMGGIPAMQAAYIARELCLMIESLAALQPGVLHCDLKPKNVLLVGDSGIKVIDFGIAKRITDPAGVDNPFQSIPYSSPERLRTRIANVQSDLWAVSVILYQMTAGMHPFQNGDIRSRILDGTGPSPFPPHNTCPQPLRQIVLKALDPRLENRYSSPGEMAEDLDRFLTGQEVAAPDPQGTIRTEQPAEPTVKTDRPPSIQPLNSPNIPNGSRGRRRPVGKLLVVGGISFVVLSGAYRWHSVRTDARLVRTDLESAKLNLAQAWDRYQPLRSSWVPTYGLREAIIRKSQEIGALPIRDYEQEKPASYEGEWQRGADAYNHLLEFEPRNTVWKSKLLICTGHLKRIRAHNKKNGRPNLDQKMINQAIQDFNEAARLQPDSPDAYIGLARIYFYDEFDFDRGKSMIEEAAKRNHPIGRREQLEMADGWRELGKRGEDKAKEFMDMPADRMQWLTKARDDYRSALAGYQEVVDFMPGIPRVIKSLNLTLQKLDTEIAQASTTS